MERKGRLEWINMIFCFWWSINNEIFLAVNFLFIYFFFIFSKHVVEQKKLFILFIWIRSLQLPPKNRFREFTADTFATIFKLLIFRYIWATSFWRKRQSRIFVLSKLHKIYFLLFTMEAVTHLFNGFIFFEKWAWIWIQFSLQLTDTLKGGQL